MNKHRTDGLCLYGIHILYAFVNISAKVDEGEYSKLGYVERRKYVKRQRTRKTRLFAHRNLL